MNSPRISIGNAGRGDFIRRYAVAAVAAACAAGFRLALVPVLGPTSPYITFYLAIVLAAALGGLGPGVLVTTVGVALGFMLLPAEAIATWTESVRLVLFVLSGVGISLIAEAMHRKRQQLAAVSRLPEENPDPVLRLGRDGEVLYANRRAVRLMEDERRICHEPLPKALFAAAKNVLAAGAPREVHAQCADGPVFSFYCVPVPEKGYVNMYGRDVTELTQVQAALRQASEANERDLAQLEAVVGSMDEALVISDLAGNILTFNRAALRLHGFEDVEQARRHLSEYPDLFEVTDLDGKPLPTAAWPLGRALHGEAFTHQEIRVRRRDTGREFIGSYNGRPVRDRDGKVILAIVTIRDVTEQKRAEEDLRTARKAAEDASRAKTEYLAKMSHEIRTPMTVILGCLEQLAAADAPPAEQRLFVDMASSAARRLLGIVNDVLDVSKIEARQVEIKSCPFDLHACVHHAVEIFTLPAQEKGVGLECQVAPQPSQVEGDCERLSQILVNLVGNAVKFTERGEVMVRVSAGPDGGVVFTVRDTGIGIPRDKLQAIFEPFNQGDSSRSRQYGGTGLGLTIAKELVELMGGTIRAESEEGHGSTFTIILPLRPAEPEGRPKEERETAAVRHPLQVLVAEDDPAVSAMVEKILHRRGWEVVVAENGRRAVERWEEGAIDVVLMDIKMPEMDGIAATRQIRQREGKKKRPCIIALTAHSRPEDRQKCLAAGMDGFLTKPMRMKELEAAIGGCLH